MLRVNLQQDEQHFVKSYTISYEHHVKLWLYSIDKDQR
jgi:hypothetical protein